MNLPPSISPAIHQRHWRFMTISRPVGRTLPSQHTSFCHSFKCHIRNAPHRQNLPLIPTLSDTKLTPTPLLHLPIVETVVWSGLSLLAVDLLFFSEELNSNRLDCLRRQHSRLQPRFGQPRGPGRIKASLRQPERCECSSSAVSSKKTQGRDAAPRYALFHLCA